MVRSAETGALDFSQPRRPNPRSTTAAPRRPTTTDAPGNPPAVMPRSTTWSIIAKRSADIPTAFGALVGSPPPETTTAGVPPGPVNGDRPAMCDGTASPDASALNAVTSRDSKMLPARLEVEQTYPRGRNATDLILLENTNEPGLDLRPM